MQIDKALRQEIINYLNQYPPNSNTKDKYSYASQKFNVDKEYIRGIWRSIKEVYSEQNSLDNISKQLKQYPLSEKESFKVLQSERFQDTKGLTVTTNSEVEIKTLEDLLTVCDVDGKLWEVVSWGCKKWDLGIKNKDEQIETKALFSVSAKFKSKSVETDLGLQKDLLLKELYNIIPAREYKKKTYKGRGNLLEICLFDVHFGKLAHAEESGEDYDLKIATQRFEAAVEDILSRVDITRIERILFPIGNDMINVDNSNDTTSAGTPQNCDSRFYKVVRSVKELLIKTIDKLATIAPVDTIVVQGNHDTQTMFLIGEILQGYYHNSKRVTIANEHKFRKYYQYGNTGILFTHGNNEKHNTLGLTFATEEPQLWANTKFRFAQLGHFHHNKTMNHVSVAENPGFIVQIMPSLSSNDAWHRAKSYNSLRQAKGFLFDYEDGLIAEFVHTAKIGIK